MTIPTLYLFIYFFSKSHYGDKYSKTTKARNLKFGHIISLYMNSGHCNFGGSTSRGLGHMLLVLLSDFSHVLAHAAVAKWLKVPMLKSQDLSSIL